MKGEHRGKEVNMISSINDPGQGESARRYFSVIPETKIQVVPLAPSLFDMPAIHVFHSAASVEDIRVGTRGPLTNPPRRNSQVEGLNHFEGCYSHIEQIISG